MTTSLHSAINSRGTARTWALGSLLVVLVIVVGAIGFYELRKKLKEDAAQAAFERELRQTPVIEVAPGPIPLNTPLKGSIGQDTWGYPTQYVDLAAMRSLLINGRFDDLEKYFEFFQSEFEKDPTKEFWVADAASAFATSEPKLRDQLDAWVKAKPKSFAAYLSRGGHWTDVGFAMRGTAFVDKTHADNFTELARAFAIGEKDLLRAVELRPRLIAAHIPLMRGYKGTSQRTKLDAIVIDAVGRCRTCFLPRANAMLSMLPRWGGSYEAMSEFARLAPVENNPLLKVLPGFIYDDQADVLRSAKRYEEALVAINTAVASTDYWQWYVQRSQIYRESSQLALAVTDAEHAALLRPGHPNVLRVVCAAHFATKNYEMSGRALLDWLRIDPADSSARAYHASVVQGAVYLGWESHKAAKRLEAIRVFDLATELDPQNRDASRARSSAIVGDKPRTAEELAALVALVKKEPGNYYAVLQLDYIWSLENKYDQILLLWDAYLIEHPDDGRAYLERAGTYVHLRKPAESKADAKKACELGLNRGCVLAK